MPTNIFCQFVCYVHVNDGKKPRWYNEMKEEGLNLEILANNEEEFLTQCKEYKGVLTDKDLEHVSELKPVLKEARARKEAKKDKKKATDMKRSMEHSSQSLEPPEPPRPPQPPPRVKVRHLHTHTHVCMQIHTHTTRSTYIIHACTLQRLRPPSSVMTWEQLEKQFERMNFLA